MERRRGRGYCTGSKEVGGKQGDVDYSIAAESFRAY